MSRNELKPRESSRLLNSSCRSGTCCCYNDSRENLQAARGSSRTSSSRNSQRGGRDACELRTSRVSFADQGKEPLKYPRAVGFIISNEFCERFNYYGMRTILVLYLTNKLQYHQDTATVLFHVFTMLVYLCPLIGAIVADSWLGKFKTILYLSIVYAFGTVVVALGAVPPLQLPVKEATIIGLVLIAVGTGGIKPCVSAFGGDQFRIPEQTAQLATFFSLFYFAINAGSMISTSITPILREDVHCFGNKDCYSLAFGVPAVLMLLSVVIFLAGRRLYVVKPPAGNMIFGVSKCIADALGGWRRERKTNPRKHWLDYAEGSCGQKLVADTKTLLKILVLYLPFPVFWALFDQQGSRWTFQATRMDGEIWGYTVKPDQMQVINPLLILGFIPLFDYVLYPILAKFGIRRPLQKLTLGGLLAAAAFLLSAFVELKLEAVQPALLGAAEAQLRIYNGNPCAYRFTTDLPLDDVAAAAATDKGRRHMIESLGLWEQKQLAAPQELAYHFKASASSKNCPSPIAATLRLRPGRATSYFLVNDRLEEFEDSPSVPKQGGPAVRVLLNMLEDPASENAGSEDSSEPGSGPGPIQLRDPADVVTDLAAHNASQLVNVLRGDSVLRVRGHDVANITTKAGGVYALIVHGSQQSGFTAETHVITPPNSVHMMWQLPQIVVITAAEIMFSVTGLEFSFTQAPQSMKSVLQACWLLSVAIGNMLVVVIAELKFFDSQAAEFTLFAGLMVIDMFIFMLLAMRYKYVEHVDDPEVGQVEVLDAADGPVVAKDDRDASVAAKKARGSATNGLANDGYVENEH